MIRRALTLLLVVVVVVVVVACDVFARVGGGESFSGGSSSSSGSGGSSGGGGSSDGGAELLYYLFRFLLWLTIEHPVIGIPVDILVIIGLVVYFKRKNELTVFSVSSAPTAAATESQPLARLEALQRFDPNFSEITFSDFCYSLYARAHEARGRRDLERYAPYLSANARRLLLSRNGKGLTEVRGVVIGAYRVEQLQGLDTDTLTITVYFESNYTEVFGTNQSSWYVRERWMLERRRDILSPPPEKAKADHCPRCGAALRTRTDGACEYCGVKIESGAFQWYVRNITSLAREARGPLLTSNVPERGTENPTVFQPRFGEHRQAFEAAHPGFDWTAFEQRIRDIAIELQAAWTARDWERVRPLESDSLFQMHRYWIDAYRQQRLRNVVEDFTIHRLQPVKFGSDAFYESITMRIWAQGRDFTVDEGDRVVAGSKTQMRQWTEYWTFIRHRVAEGGVAKVACPNCGATVAVGATGICEYCGGKLTSGTFDWVLSRIEQDDAYRG